MGLAQEFTNLGEDFIGSFDARVKFLGENIVDVKRHKAATHRFLNKAKSEHKAMGRKLRHDLGAFVNDLEETVEDMRDKFHKEQNAVRRDCKAAHQAWVNVSKKMKSKRKNIKTSLTKAKQNAARLH